MTIKYVEFSDAEKITIISEFDSPQDTAWYPYQGEIEETDLRYVAFLTGPSVVVTDPVDKLKAFLLENPDVANILN